MPPKRAAQKVEEPPEPLILQSTQPSPDTIYLRTNVKWAAVTQYLTTFFPAIGVADYTVQMLEEDLVDSTFIILPKLMHKMLYNFTLDRRINAETWEIYLRKQFIKRTPETNPMGTEEDPIQWASLGIQEKLDVLYQVTEWPFTNPARLRLAMNDDDNYANWRIEPIGYDAKRNAYWFLGGERLWIQRSRTGPPRRKKATPKAVPAPRKRGAAKKAVRPKKSLSKPKKMLQPSTSTDSLQPRRSKRAAVVDSLDSPARKRRMLGTRISSRIHGKDDEWQQIPDEWLEPSDTEQSSTKGKARATTATSSTRQSSMVDEESDLTELSDEESDKAAEENESQNEDEESSGPIKADREGAGKDKTPPPPGDDPNFIEWETICVTLDDWYHVTEQFSKSMSSYERALHKRLSQEIVPYIVEMVEERQRQLYQEVEEVIFEVGRKRSSRLAVLEAERDRLRAEAAAKAEEDAKLDRSRRQDARERLIMSDRERREKEREERKAERELQELIELQAAEQKEKLETERSRAKAERAGHFTTDANEVAQSNGRPVRRTRTAPSRSTMTSDTEKWELDCEICQRKGWNIDDGKVITACERCGKWQHTECHDLMDDKAGRPRRNWDSVDFICRSCQKKKARLQTSNGNPNAATVPTANGNGAYYGAAPQPYPYPPHPSASTYSMLPGAYAAPYAYATPQPYLGQYTSPHGAPVSHAGGQNRVPPVNGPPSHPPPTSSSGAQPYQYPQQAYPSYGYRQYPQQPVYSGSLGHWQTPSYAYPNPPPGVPHQSNGGAYHATPHATSYVVSAPSNPPNGAPQQNIPPSPYDAAQILAQQARTPAEEGTSTAGPVVL